MLLQTGQSSNPTPIPGRLQRAMRSSTRSSCFAALMLNKLPPVSHVVHQLLSPSFSCYCSFSPLPCSTPARPALFSLSIIFHYSCLSTSTAPVAAAVYPPPLPHILLVILLLKLLSSSLVPSSSTTILPPLPLLLLI